MKKIAAAILAVVTGAACAEITGIVTRPGGTTGQVQYNNNGQFAGIPGTSSSTLASVGTSTSSLQAQLNRVGIDTTTLHAEVVPVSRIDLSTVAHPGACTLPNFVEAINSGQSSPTCAQPSDVTGNAATVTNGVYATGSYPNPAWITSLSTSKIDLSTVTAALAGKQATGNYITALTGDVTASGPGSSAATNVSATRAGGFSVTYGLSAGSMTVVNGLTASSATLTATGNTQYSLATSSGINVQAGMVVAPGGFVGPHYGNLSSGIVNPLHKTIAQLQAISPTVGDQYTCSDCSPVLVVTATGTSAGNFNFSGGGSGGAPGAVISSGTVSGGAVGVLAGSIAAGTTLYFDSAGLIVNHDTTNNAAVISVKNLTFVASTVTYPSGTTTNTTFIDCLANSTATWNQGNNKTLICYNGDGSTGTNDYAAVQLLLDGAPVSGYSNTQSNAASVMASQPANLSFCVETPAALSAGQHSACLRFRTTAGTLSIPASVGSQGGSQLSVMELATGGAGYSVPGSTQTVGFSGSFSGTSNGIGVAGSTVTMTTRGGDVLITFSGTMGNSANARTLLGAIVDGSYAGICKQTSSTALTKFYESSSAAPYQIGFSCRVSLAAGAHSFALTGYVDSGTGNVCGEASPASSCIFRVDEIVNTAGSGDVSSNGNNTLSGTLNLNGAVTLGSANFFESPEETITATTPISVAHSLGVVPKMFKAIIRCKTAELGYSVGDEAEFLDDNGSADAEPACWANSTNVGCTPNAQLAVANKTTGSYSDITLADWKIVLRAWRY